METLLNMHSTLMEHAIVTEVRGAIEGWEVESSRRALQKLRLCMALLAVIPFRGALTRTNYGRDSVVAK